MITPTANSPDHPLLIRAGEHGKIRLFQLDMRPEQVAFLRDEPGALAQILGVDHLDMAQADLFDVADLEDLGLAGYLAEGCGVAAEDLDADHALLASLAGPMLVLRSRAFDGTETRLTPATQVTLVAAYSEASVKWSARAVTAESAKPYAAVRPSPRAARAEARRLGFIFFAVVMSLFILILAALIL